MQRSNEDILLHPATHGQMASGSFPDSRLSSLLAEAPDLAKRLLSGQVDDRADAQVVVQNVRAIMAQALRDHNGHLFSDGIHSLLEIWKVGSFDAMLPVDTPQFEASLWENIAGDLYALGALAVIHQGGPRHASSRFRSHQENRGCDRARLPARVQAFTRATRSCSSPYGASARSTLHWRRMRRSPRSLSLTCSPR